MFKVGDIIKYKTDKQLGINSSINNTYIQYHLKIIDFDQSTRFYRAKVIKSIDRDFGKIISFNTFHIPFIELINQTNFKRDTNVLKSRKHS